MIFLGRVARVALSRVAVKLTKKVNGRTIGHYFSPFLGCEFVTPCAKAADTQKKRTPLFQMVSSGGYYF